MPSHNSSSAASWLFRDNSVIVQDCNSQDAWGYFPLFVKFSECQLQALISLRFVADLANFEEPQALTLSIAPETVAHCNLVTAAELPSGIKNQLILDKAIASASDTLILSLDLTSPGCVIAPTSSKPLSPKESCRSSFVPFYTLCQSKRLELYLPKSRIGAARAQRLKALVDLAQTGKLQSLPTDLKRQAGGKGLQETDWHAFHVSEAPPAYVGIDLDRDRAITASNKRPRIESSPIPDVPPSKKTNICPDDAREASPPASYHPSQATTEADEPSTQDVSDAEVGASERPRDDRAAPQQPASSPANHRLAAASESPSPPPYQKQDDNNNTKNLLRTTTLRRVIRRELPTALQSALPGVLRDVMPDVLREALGGTARSPARDTAPPAPAPAPVRPTTTTSSSPSSNPEPRTKPRPPPATSDADNARLEALLDARLNGLLDAKLPTLLETKLPALLDEKLLPLLEQQIEQKLPAEVDAQIAGLLDDAVEWGEVRVGEVVDDALLEMKSVREDCVREIGEVGREAVEEVKEVGEEVALGGMGKPAVLGRQDRKARRGVGGRVRGSARSDGGLERRAVSI